MTNNAPAAEHSERATAMRPGRQADSARRGRVGVAARNRLAGLVALLWRARCARRRERCWSCGGLRTDVGRGRPGAGHAEECGAVPAHHGDCLVDDGAFGVTGWAEISVDAADEPPDPGDLLLAGGGVGAGPLVDATPSQQEICLLYTSPSPRD